MAFPPTSSTVLDVRKLHLYCFYCQVTHPGPMSARCGEMHLSRTALQNRKQQALIDKLTEKIAKLEEAIEGKQKVNLELSKKVIALEKDANGEMAKELEEEWRTNLKLLAELEHERSMSTIDPAKQPFART